MLIDTGDRIDGNGLYDASNPKGIFTTEIFKEQTIDLICSGNHELYKQKSSENEYLKTVPNFGGNYLASNIDIFDPRSGDKVPLAPRFKKFTTQNQGIRILAFGFLYNFRQNSNNTFVQPVEKTVQEEWFQQAIRDRDIDLFLIIGHVPLRGEEFKAIFKAIRDVQWDTPIQFFGGHTHIRDYVKYDSKASALESGRYMETIGFLSIKGLATGGRLDDIQSRRPYKPGAAALRASPTFARRYIDNNLFSYYHHTSLNSTTFSTVHGRNVSNLIAAARKALKLDDRFGCAPVNLWTNRAPFPSNDSIFTWLQTRVFPDMIHDTARGNKPTLVLANTGALRFDIFEGAFTIDTTYTISPFTSGFRYIKDVPFSIAKKLLVILNSDVPPLENQIDAIQAKLPVSAEQLRAQHAGDVFDRLVKGSQIQALLQEDGPSLSPGYTTIDDGGTDGDDTVHSHIKFYRVPNCIESRIRFPSTTPTVNVPANFLSESDDPGNVDLVYNEFIQPFILLALEFLGTAYRDRDTDTYMKGSSMTTLIAEWVKEFWNGEC